MRLRHFSDQEIEKISKLYNSADKNISGKCSKNRRGITLTDLAKKYGCSVTKIHHLIKIHKSGLTRTNSSAKKLSRMKSKILERCIHKTQNRIRQFEKYKEAIKLFYSGMPIHKIEKQLNLKNTYTNLLSLGVTEKKKYELWRKQLYKIYSPDLTIQELSDKSNSPQCAVKQFLKTDKLKYRNAFDINRHDKVKSLVQMIGKKNQKLTITNFNPISQRFTCKCDCENITHVRKGNFENTMSCGCMRFQCMSVSETLFLDEMEKIVGRHIQRQFPLEGKSYDGQLDNYLIEIDAKKAHGTPKLKANDAKKEMIAKRHGYNIIRFRCDSVADIKPRLDQYKNIITNVFSVRKLAA